MRKAEVLKHFGSVAKAAEFFGIEPQAIYQWKDDAIPRERELELMVRIPEKFRLYPPTEEARA